MVNIVRTVSQIYAVKLRKNLFGSRVTATLQMSCVWPNILVKMNCRRTTRCVKLIFLLRRSKMRSMFEKAKCLWDTRFLVDISNFGQFFYNSEKIVQISRYILKHILSLPIICHKCMQTFRATAISFLFLFFFQCMDS